MTQPNKEPRADISNKALLIGMAAVSPIAVMAGHNIYKAFQEDEPTSSLEQVQHDLGVEPKSAEPLQTAEMPAAQLPQIDLANTVKVELPPSQG